MPARAFIDSDALLVREDAFDVVCLNAREGIYWFRFIRPSNMIEGQKVLMPARAFIDSDWPH